MTKEELDKLEKEGKIAYRFAVFGSEYAYLKEEVFSQEDYVMEMHYTTIYDWKKITPQIKTIYILPRDINIAIEKTKERNLSPQKEKERVEELKEHYNIIQNNKELRETFDYIVYNNYDKQSEQELLDLIKKIKEGR